MSKNKGRFKEHISAAKDWLGKAEQSIDDRNDIRGDLNLILAQAELQKATENKGFQKRKNVMLKALAICAALLIAVGGMALLKMEHGPFRTDTAQINVEQKNVTHKPAAAEPQPVQEPAEPQYSYSEEAVVPEETVPQVHQEIQPKEQPVYQAPEPVQEKQELQVDAASGTATMPSADKQKLMQSAGKILRQQ